MQKVKISKTIIIDLHLVLGSFIKIINEIAHRVTWCSINIKIN